MDIRISYAVKLPNKPIVYVYRVANEDEAKKAAIAYFDNTLTGVTVIEQTPFRGRIPGYSSEEDNALIDDYIHKAEYIRPFAVDVSDQYISASIEDNMIMTVTTNDNAIINVHTNAHDDDSEFWLNTLYVQLTPIIITRRMDDEVKEDDKE